MKIETYNDMYWSRLFDKESAKYYRVMKDKIKKVVGLLEDVRGGRILDIGCGDGYIASIIGRNTGAEMHGIDVALKSVNTAKKNGIKARRLNLDGARLPYNSGYFDAVFCGDVIEHLFDTETLLENIHRVLKPGSVLILSTPNVAAWYNRFFLLAGYMPVWIESSSRTYVGNPFMKECAGHVRAFTKKSLKELLEMKKFEVEHIKGCNIAGCGEHSARKEGIWNRVDRAFSSVPGLSSTLIARARKI